MVKRAKFPAPGSVVLRKLVPSIPTEPREGEHPEAFTRRREWCEALEHVVVGVRMLRDERVAEIGHEFTMLLVAEEKRKAALEAAGEHVPAVTPEGRAAFRAHQRSVIDEAVSYVKGIDVGEVSSDDAKGPDLINLIADAGLLAEVATCAREAQRPTPTQLER